MILRLLSDDQHQDIPQVNHFAHWSLLEACQVGRGADDSGLGLYTTGISLSPYLRAGLKGGNIALMEGASVGSMAVIVFTAPIEHQQ